MRKVLLILMFIPLFSACANHEAESRLAQIQVENDRLKGEAALLREETRQQQSELDSLRKSASH